MVHAVAPSVGEFTGNAVRNHPVHAKIPVTGGGNGDMVKGIESRQGFKQPFEGQASFFQETHIQFAVLHQFFLKIKDDVLGTLLLMPLFQGLLGIGGHGFRPRTFGAPDG